MNNDLLCAAQCLRPPVFHSAVGASIEIPILGEMVEAVAGTVETGSNEMTAIVTGATIRLTCLSLRLAGAFGDRSIRKFGNNFSWASDDVDIERIAISHFPLPVRVQ